MRAALVVLAVLAGLAALGALAISAYTANKLARGRMARGEIPGATFVDAKVLRSTAHEGGRDERTGRRFPDQCELELDVPGRSAPVRDWADAPECAQIVVGGTVPVAVLPGGDLYLKHGTWASPGNGAFDEKLLFGERMIAAVAGAAALVLAGIALALHRWKRRLAGRVASANAASYGGGR